MSNGKTPDYTGFVQSQMARHGAVISTNPMSPQPVRRLDGEGGECGKHMGMKDGEGEASSEVKDEEMKEDEEKQDEEEKAASETMPADEPKPAEETKPAEAPVEGTSEEKK